MNDHFVEEFTRHGSTGFGYVAHVFDDFFMCSVWQVSAFREPLFRVPGCVEFECFSGCF